MASQNSKLRQQSGGGNGDMSNETVDELKKELDHVYRLKARNDQELIDAKNRLTELEKEISRISTE